MKTQKIDKKHIPTVGELLHIARKKKIITPRFRLPVSFKDATVMLDCFYRAEVESRHREYVFDPYMQSNLFSIATALTSDNSKFGILLCGACGNGKTTFLYAIRNLINWMKEAKFFDNDDNIGMIITNAREIAFNAKQNYNQFLKLAKYKKILAIDELGVEPNEVLDYGNVYNPVIELIELRYNNQYTTFITSNLDPDEIREKYDVRISDRLKEMVEQIVFERTFEQSYRRL